eukprot:150918_1
MASSHFLMLTIWTLHVYISLINATCSKTKQSCENEEICTAQTAKLIYPDPATFFQENAVTSVDSYICNSEPFCQWGRMLGEECIRLSIPDKSFAAPFYNKDTHQCSIVTVPITINMTFSCCEPDVFDCDETFGGLAEREDSLYATSHCVDEPEVGELLEDIVDCYASLTFMTYIKCNISDYQGKCPPFFFNNLQQYAKCACAQLGAHNDTAYVYFKEMTNMIETVFSDFRGKRAEVCPEWTFSCNEEGEALLDVFEFVCPLNIAEDSDLTQLVIDVDEALGDVSKAEDQIEIFGDVIRVLMYSDDEAGAAIDYLGIDNSLRNTPDEIGDPCVMTETVWNLNELYGDYIPPTTPAPTDDAYRLVTSSFIVYLSMFHCIICLVI